MKAHAYCYTCKKDTMQRVIKLLLGVQEIKLHIKCPGCKQEEVRTFETK